MILISCENWLLLGLTKGESEVVTAAKRCVESLNIPYSKNSHRKLVSCIQTYENKYNYACYIRFELIPDRYTTSGIHKNNPKEQSGLPQDQRSLICGAKAYYKTDKQHPRLRQYHYHSQGFTVNREIFVVEKFSQSHQATKINLTKYFLQRIFSTANNYDAYYTID